MISHKKKNGIHAEKDTWLCQMGELCSSPWNHASP